MQKTATATFPAVATRTVADTASHAVPSRLEGIAFVIGFYTLLGIGILLGVMFMLVAVLLMTLYMSSTGFFTNGFATLVITIVAGAVIGAWMVKCAFDLWADKRSARVSTLVLASLMTVVSLLSVPVLKLAHVDSAKFGSMWIALVLGIAVCNVLAGWYLTRSEVKRYYDSMA